jgi:hypothetical protein
MRRRRWLAVAAALAAALLGAAAISTVSPALEPAARAAGPAPAYRVIVNPRNPLAAVERRFLLEAFLRKVTRWPEGELIQPVDLGVDSPVRRRFTEELLNRTVAAVKCYWQQSIFAGREVPPPELDSDEAVVRYVMRNSGAIGYVSSSANLGGARALSVR